MDSIDHIGQLMPDSKNARRHNPRNVGLIVDALHEVGAARSIVIDEDGRILAGNATVEAAAEAGIERVEVVDVDGETIVAVRRRGLTEAQKVRLALYDNRSAEAADWDPEILADLQGDDGALDGLFTDFELEDLLGDLLLSEPVADPGAELSRADELQEKWRVESGDLFVIGDHRLVCGDCTDGTVVERVMGGEKARLVVTDPPYGVEYADKNRFLNTIAPGNRIQEPIKGDHGDKQQVQEMWKSAFCEMEKIMAAGAVVYCFMPQGGDQMMMMMMMTGAGIEPRHELIWLKNNHVLGRVDYAYKHEPILYAWKAGGHKFYGDFQTSILEFPKPLKSDLHPTTKPVELIGRLVSNSSIIGGTVYDPFLGSGTTAVACEQLGRRCFGIEIEPKYVAVTLERLAGMSLEPRRVE